MRALLVCALCVLAAEQVMAQRGAPGPVAQRALAAAREAADVRGEAEALNFIPLCIDTPYPEMTSPNVKSHAG